MVENKLKWIHKVRIVPEIGRLEKSLGINGTKLQNHDSNAQLAKKCYWNRALGCFLLTYSLNCSLMPIYNDFPRLGGWVQLKGEELCHF